MNVEIIITKIQIDICIEYEISKMKVRCKTLENNTAKELLKLMPFKSTLYKLGEGEEFYFDAPKNDIKEEKSAIKVFNLGEIAFWKQGNAIIINYGKKTTNLNNEIRLISPANLWAKACNPTELLKLDDFDSEDQIIIRKID